MLLHYRQLFLKDLKLLNDSHFRREVMDALVALRDAGSIEELLAFHPVKKLQGYNHYYRLRIGEYRLGFRHENDGSLTLIRLRPRNDIYEKFPP